MCNLSNKKNPSEKIIVVIAELFMEEIRPITWELISAACKIAEGARAASETKETIQIIVPGPDPKAPAREIFRRTGIKTQALEISGDQHSSSDIFIQSLGQFIPAMNASHILIGHTAQGRDFAPGLAIDLCAAAISGVNGIRLDGRELIYSRSVLDNTRNMHLRPETGRPVILTIMPGVFSWEMDEKRGVSASIAKVPRASSSFSCNDERADDVCEFTCRTDSPTDLAHLVRMIPDPEKTGRIISRGIHQRPCRNQALKSAAVVVAAGRGIGKKESLETVFRFAGRLDGSAVGASRPLVDMGWLAYEHQVGITGAVVAPDLYIALGISGSSQHLAGMRESKCVVSINENPSAPICRHSDICICADAVDFMDAFIEAYQVQKA